MVQVASFSQTISFVSSIFCKISASAKTSVRHTHISALSGKNIICLRSLIHFVFPAGFVFSDKKQHPYYLIQLTSFKVFLNILVCYWCISITCCIPQFGIYSPFELMRFVTSLHFVSNLSHVMQNEESREIH